VFGDSTRKGDISRIESGKITPQEATIRKLCAALRISDEEMEPIRTARASALQPDQVATFSRDEVELLASRFEVATPHARTTSELKIVFNQKAEENRTLRHQIGSIDERVIGLGTRKVAAREAAERKNFSEVEAMLSYVDQMETEIAAETKEFRAANALLLGRDEEAFTHLTAAANSFAGIDPEEPSRRLAIYETRIIDHGRRHGG